jgi:hypothetical protein
MRTLLATLTATTLATTLGGAGVALALPDDATTSAIAVIAHQQTDKQINAGPKGLSPGDRDVSSARLTHAGAAYGSFDSVCEVTLATKSSVHELCSQTFNLPEGAITSAGGVVSGARGPAPFDWAITGGTGPYAEATGSVHVVPGNRAVRMTINLTS